MTREPTAPISIAPTATATGIATSTATAAAALELLARTPYAGPPPPPGRLEKLAAPANSMAAGSSRPPGKGEERHRLILPGDAHRVETGPAIGHLAPDPLGQTIRAEALTTTGERYLVREI